LTKTGRKQLRDETEDWPRMSAIINRLLETCRIAAEAAVCRTIFLV
jgi:hypothetical protein